jgi:hypothetical protein
VTSTIEDYVSWLVGLFDHADFFLVNSQSTGRDLVHVAGRLGHRVDPAAIEVVTLDGDFRQPAEEDLPPDALGRWGLAGTDYCLFVSTIESRKNHILALDAWAQLLETHGADAVPMLVCVGRVGWKNASFFERLDRNPELRRHVTVIERVTDSELALLYRSCRFTLYPSHYEGWGLPVTESLSYGRVPVVADNSSLPEAGGKFALFFESNSVTGLVSALERILFEPGCRERLEQHIAAEFKPRGWASIAAQVTRAVRAVESKDAGAKAPYVVPGLYYPVTLQKGTRIWRGLGSGEVFRAGNGWLWPEIGGSRTTDAGGELRLRVEAKAPVRLYLRIRGLHSSETAFLISADGHVIATGNLARNEERWVIGEIPNIGDDGLVAIQVRGGSADALETNTAGSHNQMRGSISVVGFVLLECADEAGRLAFIEKAALGDLGKINAYAERRRDDDARAAA